MAVAQPAANASSSNNFKDLGLNDEDDLFDAVLTGSVDKEKTVFTSNDNKTPAQDNENPIPTDASKETRTPKRLSLYIGNFPWWISDVDILNLAHTIGVQDMIEIRFAENKVNGQSRGYVEVVVTSEESMKLLLEKVPQCHLGGEKIDCRYANRHNLSLFEDKANDRIPQRAGSNEMKESNSSFLSQEPCPPTMPQHFLPQFPNTFPPLPGQFLGQLGPLFPHMPPNLPPPPFMFPNHLMPVPNHPPPSQHTNPAMAGSSHEGHNSKFHSKDRPTDGDFEDLMNRNRAVASSAISKAVSGATTGDLRVAMETLLTAIAIIKQSKVYRDDRCQALVTSLKDCLVSIQGNYGYSRSSSLLGERARDRRDTSREGERTSRRHRERSRSQERDKERSKERDRHRDRDGDRQRYR